MAKTSPYRVTRFGEYLRKLAAEGYSKDELLDYLRGEGWVITLRELGHWLKHHGVTLSPREITYQDLVNCIEECHPYRARL
jgi:hypothetical protein